MIYIKNNTEIQTIYIHRNDDMPCVHHAGSTDYLIGYDDGFSDGYESGTTDQSSRLASTAFTYNSAFTRTDGWSAVTVNVPQSGHTSEELQEWYDSGYTSGYTDGEQDGYQSGYTEGVEDGIEAQKELLASTAFTYNGEYQNSDGWSSVTVNVNQSGHTDQELLDMYESGYTSGHTDGVNEQKDLLVSTAFTENGHYERENGWNEVDVNIDTASTYQSGYTDGYESGTTHQQEMLSTSAFSENGNYVNASGWSAISITVNQSGHTDQELEDAWNSGYTSGHTDGFTDGYGSGYTDGYNSGYTSGWTNGFNSGYSSGMTYQQSLLSSTEFVLNGTYTNENGWSSVTVNVDSGMGELFCLYGENAVFDIGDALERREFEQISASVLPLGNFKITIIGNDGTSSYYDDMAHFYWSGNSSQYRFYADVYSNSSHYWRNTTTSTTRTTKTFPSFHAVNFTRLSTNIATVDTATVTGNTGTRIRETYGITLTGASYYLACVNINNGYCNVCPWVDDNGRACLRYNGVNYYPSSGNAYAVYRKNVNGQYIYYIARTIQTT